MNTRGTVSLCLILLLVLFGALAYRSRLLPAHWTSAVTGEPDPGEPAETITDEDLSAEMLQRVKADGVRSIETMSVSHGRCVFVGTMDGYWDLRQIGRSRPKSDLWLVDGDGGLQRLTTDGMSYDPEWSPSGSEIAFVNQGSINVVDATSKEVRAVVDAYLGQSPDERDNSYQYVVNDHPRWSPNGKALAVLADDGSGVWLRVVTTLGKEICQFGRGISDCHWDSESALVLDYCRFEFDWGNLFSNSPPDRASEDLIDTDMPEPLEDYDAFAATLLEKLRKSGVVKIADITVSPSHELVVCVAELRGSDSDPATDLWLAHRDGAGLRRLTHDGRSGCPVWSPSGTEIAMVNEGSVEVLDVSTGNIRGTDLQAAHWGDCYEASGYDEPQWAPNGKLLAAFGSNRTTEVWLTVVDASSGNQVFQSRGSFECREWRSRTSFWTSHSELVIDSYGKLIIDWEKLASAPVVASQPVGRYLGMLLRKVTAYGIIRVREYSPSPDGNLIVFVGEYCAMWCFVGIQIGRPQSDLWLVRKNGTGLRRLTHDGMSYDPAWSSTGKELAFVFEAGVYVLTIKTGLARVLPGLQGYRGSIGECDYLEYRHPRWAPNSKAISALSGNGCASGWLRVAEASSGRGLFQIETTSYEWDDYSDLRFEQGNSISIDWKGISGLAHRSK